jgi:hypothetical protein
MTLAKHGLSTRVIVNGFDTSGIFNSADINAEAEMFNVTVFNSAGLEYIPGQPDAKVVLEGFLPCSDPVALNNLVDTEFRTKLGALPANNQLILIGPEGYSSQSDLILIASGDAVNYKTNTQVKGIAQINLGFQASNGLLIAVPLAPVQTVAAGASQNGAAVDNGAATTKGLIAQFHVLNFAAAGTLDLKVQHSPDGAVWTDLVTLPQKNARGAFRLEVAGTVNRYTRVVRSSTGGPVTFAVAIHRKS